MIEKITKNDSFGFDKLLLWFGRIVLVLFIFLPLYKAFLVSIGSGTLSQHGILPNSIRLVNYIEVFDQINLMQQLVNSLIYAVSITALNLVVTIPAAYALSRYEFRGKLAFMFGLLITQMFAAIIIIPALYTLIRTLGLVDTRIAVILIVGAITIPLSTWLLKGFIDSIPVEIEEAAMIDGCSRLTIMRKIVVPTAAPGIITAGIFTFINGYQNFIIPLIFVSDTSKLPVTVGIYNLFGELNPPYQYVMAATIISIIPLLIVYVLAQNYIVEGLTSGSIKG